MKDYELSNGVKIPCMGFGTWAVDDGQVAIDSVKKAIEAHYTLIDTAARYGNEKSIGVGLKESGIKREDLFLTSKVWNDHRGYQKVMEAFDKTIHDLGVDYLDLYLIHWPASAHQYDNYEEINRDTWQALIDLYKAGKVRAIGVSNFKVHHLKALMDMEITPMVNQIECHPGHYDQETISYCQAHNIVMEAWSPLGRGRVLNDERLGRLAKKNQMSTAQLCLAWNIAHKIIPLVKSTKKERMVENLAALNYTLSAEDVQAIDTMGEFGFSGQDPDTIDF